MHEPACRSGHVGWQRLSAPVRKARSSTAARCGNPNKTGAWRSRSPDRDRCRLAVRARPLSDQDSTTPKAFKMSIESYHRRTAPKCLAAPGQRHQSGKNADAVSADQVSTRQE